MFNTTDSLQNSIQQHT